MDYTERYNRVNQDTEIGVITKKWQKIHRYCNFSEYRYIVTLPYSISEFSVAHFEFEIF